MRRMGLGLGLLLMVAACGCDDLVVSLQPLATEDTAITDSQLVGKWVSKDLIWEFTPTDSKEYRLRVVEMLSSSTFRANLVEIGGQRFLDIVPDDVTQGRPTGLVFAMHLVPGHGIFKIQMDRSRLSLQNLDHKGFLKRAEADPGILQYETVDDRVVLTDSSRRLQAFVAGTADANDLWEDTLDFTRGRPLYTRDQVTVDPNLAGRWSDANVVLEVTTPGDDRLYHINGWVEGELPFSAWAYLVGQDGAQFWAAFLDKPDSSAKTTQIGLIPDLVIHVEQTGHQLQLQVAEPKVMAKAMNGDPNGLVFDQDETLILIRQDSGTAK
jgi:hypothetical protein